MFYFAEVRNTKDETKSGRCQVIIYGLNDDEK
jgi:hypothetical protein